MRRALDAFVVAALAALGLGCLLGPLADSSLRADGGLLLPAVGIFMLGVAYTMAQLRLTLRDAAARTSTEVVDGEPAVVVALRPTTLRVMLAIGATGSLLGLVAVLGVGVSDGGLFFAPFLVLFTSLLPDAARALTRRPRLVLTPRALLHRGWTVDAELAWDDVVSVTREEGRRPRLVVTGLTGAASWRVERHQLVLPLDQVPCRPEVVVLRTALDEPTRVEVLAGRLAELPAADRAAALGPDAIRFLAGER